FVPRRIPTFDRHGLERSGSAVAAELPETAALPSSLEVAMSKSVHRLRILGCFALAAIALPAAVAAQPLPTPKDFVANLDVRCYALDDQPPLNVPLHLDHLNPYFVEKGLPPPDNVLPFIRFVDWKCYGITGPSLDLDIHLDHLNPEIPPLLGPAVDGTIREPQ